MHQTAEPPLVHSRRRLNPAATSKPSQYDTYLEHLMEWVRTHHNTNAMAPDPAAQFYVSSYQQPFPTTHPGLGLRNEGSILIRSMLSIFVANIERTMKHKYGAAFSEGASEALLGVPYEAETTFDQVAGLTIFMSTYPKTEDTMACAVYYLLDIICVAAHDYAVDDNETHLFTDRDVRHLYRAIYHDPQRFEEAKALLRMIGRAADSFMQEPPER